MFVFVSLFQRLFIPCFHLFFFHRRHFLFLQAVFFLTLLLHLWLGEDRSNPFLFHHTLFLFLSVFTSLVFLPTVAARFLSLLNLFYLGLFLFHHVRFLVFIIVPLVVFLATMTPTSFCVLCLL